jgi:sugar phosphate isomerase/epimerase
MLAEHDMRLAYENWCWATAAPTWRDVYELVMIAGRSNIGLCLDTFQTAGGEWGDPTTQSGHREDVSENELNEMFGKSLHCLRSTIPPEKIFLLQVSNAYKPPKPLDPNPDESGLRSRGRWSAAYRPMPGKDGGYLPILEVAKAVKGTGFMGWFSVEIFDGGPSGAGGQLGDLDTEAKEIMRLSRKFIEQIMNA